MQPSRGPGPVDQHPGLSRITAEVFVAETGADMSVFPTAGHLASWAGLSPGSNESAGRTKSTNTRPGNRYLKGALGIATRRGPMRAIVAVEHAMVIAAWNLLVNSDFYRDPGPDYYTARQPARTRARASANSKPSDTESPSNHSPKPDNTRQEPITRCGHSIFVSAPAPILSTFFKHIYGPGSSPSCRVRTHRRTTHC